jgi:hypothetical protein
MAGKKVLLVEGVDDKHVMGHICGNRGIPPLDEIKDYDGVDDLLKSFPIRLKMSEGDIIGVVIDADTDLASHWEAIRNPLIQKGYASVPTAPSLDGTIIDPPAGTLLPRVGVWIMPDNRTTGILEDFLRFLVPEGSVLFRHATESVATIPAGERRFGEAAKPKAVIHTWLAWQEKPGRPLGTAITARYLDPNVPQVDVLVSWLKTLFLL